MTTNKRLAKRVALMEKEIESLKQFRGELLSLLSDEQVTDLFKKYAIAAGIPVKNLEFLDGGSHG